MDLEPVQIRPCRPDDLDDLYRICLLTADNGGDGTALFRDPRLPGHIYAAPYALFEPSLAFVADDGSGGGGYIVGALNSRAFERRLDHDWWPALRASYPEPSPDVVADLSQPEQDALHNIHHPWGTEDELADRYPSHLHINLLPRLQGRGNGRRLVAALKSALRDQGSRGLHLHVSPSNQRAIEFYRHVGFTERPAAYARVFAMEFKDRPE
jgi:ribosomal protein S18 acetylase RimI-like enzyme